MDAFRILMEVSSKK